VEARDSAFDDGRAARSAEMSHNCSEHREYTGSCTRRAIKACVGRGVDSSQLNTPSQHFAMLFIRFTATLALVAAVVANPIFTGILEDYPLTDFAKCLVGRFYLLNRSSETF